MDTRSITSGGLAAPSDWSGETEGTYPRFGILKVDLGWMSHSPDGFLWMVTSSAIFGRQDPCGRGPG